MFPCGILNAQRYRDDSLDSLVCPYAVAIDDTFILQTANAIHHIDFLMHQFLEEESIPEMTSTLSQQ
ncbi:hypothetical protein CEXT_538491 [Caerostris extrusa]|uniref:Uncharacterized protein n=1 Tax=Caerostris extrusa TaxID=172846 RepID=A0AAV4MFB0_CAEEX|nr:hypothetical protein CEXT_538491 [Caerostris extrusa]